MTRYWGKIVNPRICAIILRHRDDNGGIHSNDGILNRAFYLTAVALGGFAWEKAAGSGTRPCVTRN